MSTGVTVGAGVTRPDLTRSALLRPRLVGAGDVTFVLVHGVGVGSEAFGRVARRLARSAAVAVVDRAGYGRADVAPATAVSGHVADLAAAVDAVPGRRVLVGVSGGATIALALGLAEPSAADLFVVHEPLVGPLAPSLHGSVVSRLARLREAPGQAGAADFVRSLVGEATWDLLGERRRREVAERAATIRTEGPSFALFSPHPADLAALSGRIVTTVGAQSGPPRREAAAALAAAGIPVVPLPGARHLPQVEQPDLFAAAVRAVGGELR